MIIIRSSWSSWSTSDHHQSVTFRFRNFSIFLDGIGITFKKFWFRKKYRYRIWKKLVTRKLRKFLVAVSFRFWVSSHTDHYDPHYHIIRNYHRDRHPPSNHHVHDHYNIQASLTHFPEPTAPPADAKMQISYHHHDHHHHYQNLHHHHHYQDHHHHHHLTERVMVMVMVMVMTSTHIRPGGL